MPLIKRHRTKNKGAVATKNVSVRIVVRRELLCVASPHCSGKARWKKKNPLNIFVMCLMELCVMNL